MRILIRSFLFLLFASVLVACKNDVKYEVYAIRYGEIGKASAIGSVIGATESDTIDVAYMIWLLKKPDGKKILVDAGFIDSTKKCPNYIRPDSALLSINISPQDISDIILTHPHNDHIGGINLFPNARIWMNQDDFDYFIGAAWEKDGDSIGLNRTDVTNLHRIKSQGRLKLLKGDDIEFMPGIKAYTGSRHTFENFYLVVNSNSEKNKVLVASDAVWFYLNLEKELPASICFDSVAYVNAMKRMKTLINNPDLILPGHDNQVFSRFPKVNDHIVRIR
jgi:glyoxylase-like metal-dependent hydrolase (beta-lactamase superfamily II)